MNTLLAHASRWAITFLVPGAVWALLVAGLYQLARSTVRRVRWPSRRPQELVQGSASS